MVEAGTFHAVAVELTVGSFLLATTATLLRAMMALYPRLGDKFSTSMATGLDGASLCGVIFGLLVVPFTIITGNLAADGGNSMTANKILLSGLCTGLWLGFLHGRLTLGIGLWNSKKLVILQSLIALSACQVVLMLSSIGGTLSRGETLTDLIGLPHLENSPDVGMTGSLLMFLFSSIVLVTVLFMQPKSKRIADE